MDIRQTCCSEDNRGLVFPSFSVVFIHTFMLSDGEIKHGVGDVSDVNLDEDENAADYFLINTIGTINLLEYCRKNGIKRIIFVNRKRIVVDINNML